MELILNQIFHFVTDRTLDGWPWESWRFIVPVSGHSIRIDLKAMTVRFLKLIGELGLGPGVNRMRLLKLVNLFWVVVDCHEVVSEISLPHF